MIEYKDIHQVNSEMKFTQIKGKDYAIVASRVQGFRKLYPEGFILTRRHPVSLYPMTSGLVSEDDTPERPEIADFTCEVGYYKEDGTKVILATGHAREVEGSSQINRGSFVENCETSAVGRALAFLGIGSNEDIASAEEVVEAQGYDLISKEKAEVLRQLVAEKKANESYILKFHKVKSFEEMTARQYAEVVKYLERGGKR